MITMKTLIATMVSAAAIAAASAPEFDANAFLGRVEKVSRSMSQKELESLVKVAEENGKAVAEAVARRLTDKSAKEDDKVKYVWILGSAKQESSVPALLDVVKAANPTSMLYHATSRALTIIGGDEVGAFFLKNYRQNKAKMDEEQRFDAGHSDGACVCVEITKDKRRIEKPMKIAGKSAPLQK